MQRQLSARCQTRKRPMRLFLIAALFISAGLFCTCSKPVTGEAGNTEVILYRCAPVFSSNKPMICFDSLLTDSRCPTNAVCVWVGYAAGKFSFLLNGVVYPFKLSTFDLHGSYSRDTIIAGYKIEFVNLLPYPGTVPAPIPDNSRRAELRVIKL